MSNHFSHAPTPPRPPPAPNIQGTPQFNPTQFTPTSSAGDDNMSETSTSSSRDAGSQLKEAAFLLIAAADVVSAATGHLPNQSIHDHVHSLRGLADRFSEAVQTLAGQRPPSVCPWKVSSKVSAILNEYRRYGRTPTVTALAASPEQDTEIARLREEVASLREARAKDLEAAAHNAAHPPPPPKSSARKRDSTTTGRSDVPSKLQSHKSAATPKSVHFTYASAAKAGLPSRANQLAVAFPKEPAVSLLHMAEKLSLKKTNSPKVRHAPHHASRHVDVSFATSQSPLVESVPLNGLLYRDLLDALGKAPDATGAPRLESVVWNHRGRFRLTFAGSVPPTLDATLTNYFARKFAPDHRAESVLIERFHFRNQVVYRRVPAIPGLDAVATSRILANELRADPLWADISLERPPNFFLPKDSPYGMLFVESTDNAASRTLKYVKSHPIYLNGNLCHAVRALDTKPPVPQCAICLRWGHRTQLCRSSTRRCWTCGDTHDERSHGGPGDPFCINCRGTHQADSKECPYYKHRPDPDWIRNQNKSAIPKSNTTAPATIRGSAQGAGSGRKGKGGVAAEAMATD